MSSVGWRNGKEKNIETKKRHADTSSVNGYIANRQTLAELWGIKKQHFHVIQVMCRLWLRCSVFIFIKVNSIEIVRNLR